MPVACARCAARTARSKAAVRCNTGGLRGAGRLDAAPKGPPKITKAATPAFRGSLASVAAAASRTAGDVPEGPSPSSSPPPLDVVVEVQAEDVVEGEQPAGKARSSSSRSEQSAGTALHELGDHMCETERALRAWIEDAGGFIHPALRLRDDTPSGSRGIIAIESLGEDVVGNEPLVVVPDGLYMSGEAARVILNPVCEKAGVPCINELDLVHQVALLIAHEETKGTDSFWHPYIQSLPEELPCAWAMSAQTLDAELDRLRTMSSGWRKRVREARRAVQQQCNMLTAVYGDVLKIDAGRLRWAVGNVLSRAYGGEGDLGMAPYIDLINHERGACKPEGLVLEDGRTLVYVQSGMDGYAQPLRAGDELKVMYVMKSAPEVAFMSFGFVPEELMP